MSDELEWMPIGIDEEGFIKYGYRKKHFDTPYSIHKKLHENRTDDWWIYNKCEICNEEAYKHYQGQISDHPYKGIKKGV